MSGWLRSALAMFAVVGLLAGAANDAAAKRIAGLVRDIPTGTRIAAQPTAHAANLPYGGGPVLHSNRTHLIFWQPAGSGLTFTPGYTSLIGTFMAEVAADSHKPTNVYGLSGQYSDAGGPAAYASTYRGGVLATDPLPANGCVEPLLTGPGWTTCLNDGQLQSEIEHVVSVDHLPAGPNDVYFLLTPNGFGSCTDATSSSCALGGSSTGYCGYHSQTSDGRLLYAVIPFNAVSGHCQSDNPRPNASTADPTISTVSHEHNETITDPLGDGWIDNSSNENGDLCLSNYGPALGGSGTGAWNATIHGGRYYIQEEWSNDDQACRARDESNRASFTASSRPTVGRPVRLSARSGDPDGAIVASNWFLGDGRVAHGRNVSHIFTRAGAYRVVLRVTDSAGNWAFVAGTVRVAKASRAGRRAG